jgi:arginase
MLSNDVKKFAFGLSYPQWQGSGRNGNLLRGARAATHVCSRFAPMAEVPLSKEEGDAHGVNRWVPILKQLRSAQEILQDFSSPSILTAGGDCAVDIAVIDYLAGVYPDLTVIWIDSHFDANTPMTSPSGNLHGMPVSVIMGEAPGEMRALLQHPIAPEQFRYVWANVADAGDRSFQQTHGLKWLQEDECFSEPVHIHLDLDVLNPQEFPFLAYPEANGMSISSAIALMRRLASQNDIVGLTLTEFAPTNDSDANTGSDVIADLCRAVCD